MAFARYYVFMKTIKIGVLLIAAQLSAFQMSAQKEDRTDMAELIKTNFAFADSQYKYMMKLVPADKMP